MHACVCESRVKSFHCMVYTVIMLELLSLSCLLKKTKFAQVSPHQQGPVIHSLGYRRHTYPIWLAKNVHSNRDVCVCVYTVHVLYMLFIEDLIIL